jgi:hypothetical protein
MMSLRENDALPTPNKALRRHNLTKILCTVVFPLVLLIMFTLSLLNFLLPTFIYLFFAILGFELRV